MTRHWAEPGGLIGVTALATKVTASHGDEDRRGYFFVSDINGAWCSKFSEIIGSSGYRGGQKLKESCVCEFVRAGIMISGGFHGSLEECSGHVIHRVAGPNDAGCG